MTFIYVGPNVLKMLGRRLNEVSLYPEIKTVEVEPHGKPPNGKYALSKSKVLIIPINIKKLLLVFTAINLNSFP